ncbi:oxidoreductase [Rubrivirga sp. IMCC45206]|uniref:oxidoreductase n=1 Tax=Rubrivirga sp. IMCC45206 TaxID=3391614 RepID=UPI00398FE175
MSDAASWALQHLPRQHGRTAVVTGANSGIGLETTRGLAVLGARVVMACRDTGRGAAAAADVLKSVPGADLDVRALDLADLRSVRAFADGLDGPVDVLVNNAGVMAVPTRTETQDGFETQFGVNVLGHFALTVRLLRQVLAADAGRVVWLSSIAHKDGKIRLDDLNGERRYDPWRAYQQSKLADLMLAFELDRRLDGTSAISLAAHPGVSSTELMDDMVGGSRLMAFAANAVMPLIAMPAWRGALPSLVAAASPDVAGSAYVGPQGFRDMRGAPGPADVASQATDRATAAALFEACERLTSETMPLALAA